MDGRSIKCLYYATTQSMRASAMLDEAKQCGAESEKGYTCSPSRSFSLSLSVLLARSLCVCLPFKHFQLFKLNSFRVDDDDPDDCQRCWHFQFQLFRVVLLLSPPEPPPFLLLALLIAYCFVFVVFFSFCSCHCCRGSHCCCYCSGAHCLTFVYLFARLIASHLLFFAAL